MTYQTINPASGKVVKTYENISDAALNEVMDVAQVCYEDDWPRRPVAQRAAIVHAAATLMRQQSDHLAGSVTLEMGKLIAEAKGEVELSANILDYYAERAEGFLKPQLIPDTPNAMIETLPLGLILGVEPWNFPYYQLARVAGPQLMVGNVLVVKHAANVPQSALAFARILEEAGAPKGAYANIFASTDQVGRLIEDPRVRGVTVTGSERTPSQSALGRLRQVMGGAQSRYGSGALLAVPALHKDGRQISIEFTSPASQRSRASSRHRCVPARCDRAVRGGSSAAPRARGVAAESLTRLTPKYRRHLRPIGSPLAWWHLIHQ